MSMLPFAPPAPDAALSDLLASFAAPFAQHARLLRLRFATDSQLPADLLLPQRLTGTEELSACYRYVLECLSADMHLELKELLGQPVEIGLLLADGSERLLAGLVTCAEQQGGDGGFARYGLVIEPALATLAHRTNSRVFQDRSVPQIVAAVLDEHRAANPVFAASFAYADELAHAYPARSYCLQYRESDLAFISRLLREEGISYRFTCDGSPDQTPHHTLVLFDDASRLEANAQAAIRFHRADGTEGEDTITAWQAARQVVSGATTLHTWDYRPVTVLAGTQNGNLAQGANGDALSRTLEQYLPQAPYYGADTDELDRYARLRQQAADFAAKQFSGEGVARSLVPGTWFELRDHPIHDHDTPEDRQFIVTALHFTADNNLPGQEAAGQDKPAQPYRNRFTAVRRGIPIVPAYTAEHAKPTALGPQTALVVGPPGEEIYTDEHGRIRVQFHWQRGQDHPTGGAACDERSSTWVRVAHPSAGQQWGTQYLPRIGQEVLITFLENDIDRPLCTGVLHNGTHPPPAFSGAGSLPANKTLSGIKTQEHHGNGYNELLFDDTPNELRTKLSSEHAKTQLNQGCLIHPRTEGKGAPRGEGFELRTDAAGAIRAAQSLLLTAEPSANAAGKQLDRQALLTTLDAALALAEQLGDQAHHQHAHLPETGNGNQRLDDDATPGQPSPRGHQTQLAEALHNLERHSNTDRDGTSGTGRQPGGQHIVAISGPDGVAIASHHSATLAAGTNLDQIAQRDSNQTTGRRWIHNVGESISLFVSGAKAKVKATFQLIAAKGNMQLQAQDGALEATAQQDVTLTSVQGKVVIQAPQEILLTAGGGYIRIGKDIEIHNPGQQSQKAANFSLAGPTQLNPSLPALPRSEFIGKHSLRFAFEGSDKLAQDLGLVGKEYTILDSTGSIKATGIIGKTGRMERLMFDERQELTLLIGDGNWKKLEHPFSTEEKPYHLSIDSTEDEIARDPYLPDLNAFNEADFLTTESIAKILDNET
jgi:type VI secretion system secreted protein VgrG